MNEKEIEKQNFILWYGFYATAKELEVARTNNRETLNRLLKEYAEEIDKVDRTKRLYDRVVQLGNQQAQGFDVTLKIDCSSSLKSDIFKEDSVTKYEIK
jgi:molybdopterin converting factor small subunit